jgi:putative membrane protein
MHAFTLLVASASGWHDGNGHDGHWWIVFPILLLLLLATAIALLWRRGRPDDGGDSPRRILGERFARGEISADEYHTRLDQLR